MKHPKLTEAEWSLVFGLRCRSKRGEHLSPAEQKLCYRAWREDGKRYSSMGPDVFAATAPFGSTVKQ